MADDNDASFRVAQVAPAFYVNKFYVLPYDSGFKIVFGESVIDDPKAADTYHTGIFISAGNAKALAEFILARVTVADEKPPVN